MQNQLRDSTVSSIRLLRRQTLEGDHVTRHGGKVFVPEPLRSVHISSNTTSTVSPHQLRLLLSRHISQPFGKARPNDNDIAVLELDTLLLRHLLNILRVKVSASKGLNWIPSSSA